MGGSVVFVFCIGSEEISHYQCATFTLIGQSEKVGALLLTGAVHKRCEKQLLRGVLNVVPPRSIRIKSAFRMFNVGLTF